MRKILSSLLFLSFISVLFIACGDDKDDDKIYDLTFEKSDYQVMVGFSNYIMIRSGNGNYTITSSDESVVKASYVAANIGFGDIVVQGLKKGEAVLTVKDNVTGQEEELNITVTEAYINLLVSGSIAYVRIDEPESGNAIKKDIEDNALFDDGFVISMLRNTDKKIYIFPSVESVTRGNVLFEGNYDFDTDGEKPYLLLNYKDGNHEYNHQFDISPSKGFNTFTSFFNIDWGNLKANEPAPVGMEMVEVLTDRYKELYPTVDSAAVIVNAQMNMLPELPLTLVK